MSSASAASVAAARVLVSFPAVRLAISPRANTPLLPSQTNPRFAGVKDFRLPQLLYHVEIVSEWAQIPSPHDPPEFLSAPPDWLPRLAGLFGASATTFRATPRELYPDAHGPNGCSDALCPIPTQFSGLSWSLSLAVGLAAAIRGQVIPPWVVLSGSLPSDQVFHPSLELAPTGSLDRKIRLCAGMSPEYELDCEGRWRCRSVGSCDVHGPPASRALPGRVKLLLLARSTRLNLTLPSGQPVVHDGLPEVVRQDLGLAAEPNWIDDIATRGLEEAITALPAEELLVLQIPTVWHALAILGLNVPTFPPKVGVHREAILAFVLRRPAADVEARDGILSITPPP